MYKNIVYLIMIERQDTNGDTMSESDKMMVISLEGMATDFHGWTEAFLLQVADRIRELNELLAKAERTS